MKKTFLLSAALVLSFGLGFAFNSLLTKPVAEQKLKRVTGIGGIFFKAKDPAKLKAWYNEHLGLNTNQYGTVFVWYQGADSTRHGYTQWSTFKETTTYFAPSTKEFMMNYRVDNMNALMAAFKKEGIVPVDTVETYDYGKFVHIMDPEGNKIELWEPNDDVYGKIGGSTTK